jgi:ABC-type nitrate/sulfonate/bicarbonate transport system substrate-binding protein
MRPTTRRTLTVLPLTLALAATLAACSGSDGGSTAEAGPTGTDAAETTESAAETGGAPEVTELTVGVVPVIDHAAVYIANQEGFFEEEGLTVTPQVMQGGAAALPAMVSGDLAAAFATYPSFFLAESKGLGVTIVAEGIRATEETGGVFVSGDSDITEPADLEGATIAVNTLNNTGDVTIKAVLEENGVDPASVSFLELAFPEMAPALERGDVDAAWLVEPFRTGVAAAGGRMALASYGGVAEGIPVSGLAMMDDFVAENPNTAAAFARAIEKANAFIADNPDAAREIVTTYSQTTAEVAAKLELPLWRAGGVDAEEIDRWNELMLSTGALTGAVDITDLVPAE